MCAALRKMSSVLRLGVYRERIERYTSPGAAASNAPASSAEQHRHHHQHHHHGQEASQQQAPTPGERHLSAGQRAEGQQPKTAKGAPPPTPAKPSKASLTAVRGGEDDEEELLTVTLERQPPATQLGVRLGDRCSEPGVFIVEVQPGGAVAADGRLALMDRILFINGQDVRHCGVEQATALIQVYYN